MKYLISFILMLYAPLLFAECVKVEHKLIEDLDHYYQRASGLSGDALKRALNTIIKGHVKYNYTPCVWEILKEADQDPDNTQNVIGIYSRRSIPKSDQDTNQNDPDSWNREHIWAKSHGFPRKSQHGYTDVHHLRAVDRSINTKRSDNDFAKGGVPVDECQGCFKGSGTWEPPDEVKGDVARMMFYMAVRYDGNDGSGTPDLELVDLSSTERSKTFGQFGKLCTLLDWHVRDKVSDEEERRNSIIQSWQGNRNPFIDRREFASAIWGDQCN